MKHTTNTTLHLAGPGSGGCGQDSPPPGPRSDGPHQRRPRGERHAAIRTQQELDVVVTREGGQVDVHQGEGVEYLHQRLDGNLDVSEASLTQTARGRVGRRLLEQPPEGAAEGLHEPLALRPGSSRLLGRAVLKLELPHLRKLDEVAGPRHGDAAGSGHQVVELLHVQILRRGEHLGRKY